jgi:hypothetical protein
MVANEIKWNKKQNEIKIYGATTLSITTLSITTLSITTLSITIKNVTLCIITLDTSILLS